MYLPFCNGKRRTKDRREPKGPISWSPSPHGQVESSRLIAGDTSAAPHLGELINRAGATSSRLPYLNSNGVVAVSNLLVGHTEDGVGRLAKEQAAAERRLRTAKRWTFGSLFFSNASLVGESFQQGILGVYGQGSRQSVQIDEAPRAPTCRGHWQWQLVKCDFEGCAIYHKPSEHPPSHPPIPEDFESLPDQPVAAPLPNVVQRVSLSPSLEEGLAAQEADEEGDEFLFEAHLRDEEGYEQALCEIAAVATRPGTPQMVTLNRKHEAGSAEAVSLAVPELKVEDEEQRWSTQAQNGCPDASAEAPKTTRPQSFRLSLAGPPTGPPSLPLPPNPPSPVSSFTHAI